MAASFNRVILIGNLTRDVELRYTGSKMAVTDIGLAVNHKSKNQQGEWIDEVTFVDITLWDRTAEIAAEYLTKGSHVLIEGRLKLDTWEKDGKKNYKLRVVGERMQMLGTKGGGGGGDRSQSGGGNFDENEYGGGGEHESSGPPAPRASAPARAPQATQPPPDEIPF